MPQDLKLSMPASDAQDNIRRRRKSEDDDYNNEKDEVEDKSSSRMAKMFKEVEDYRDEESHCCQTILYAASIIGMIILFPLVVWKMIAQVMQYQRAVVFRFGKIKPGGAKGPGIFFVNPFIDDVQKVDMRTLSFNVPPQEILSRDSVTVKVDAVVYYSIQDPVLSVMNIKNANSSTNLLASTTLRNVLGTRSLSEMLTDKESIAETVLGQLDKATDPWGIRVHRVEMKDVSLPHSMQRAMAAEAEATREARAKIIMAEGEMKASEALKTASDVISSSNSALQLRYLQTLTQLSAEKNSTIIFPVPIDMISKFIETKKDK